MRRPESQPSEHDRLRQRLAGDLFAAFAEGRVEPDELRYTLKSIGATTLPADMRKAVIDQAAPMFAAQSIATAELEFFASPSESTIWQAWNEGRITDDEFHAAMAACGAIAIPFDYAAGEAALRKLGLPPPTVPREAWASVA